MCDRSRCFQKNASKVPQKSLNRLLPVCQWPEHKSENKAIRKWEDCTVWNPSNGGSKCNEWEWTQMSPTVPTATTF